MYISIWFTTAKDPVYRKDLWTVTSVTPRVLEVKTRLEHPHVQGEFYLRTERFDNVAAFTVGND